MALKYCGECGKQVSDKASFCPHCGCPVKNKKYYEEKEKEKQEEEMTKQKEKVNRDSKTILLATAGYIAVTFVYLCFSGVVHVGDFFHEHIDVSGNTMVEYLTILEQYGMDIDLDEATTGANCLTGMQTKKIKTQKYGTVTVDFSYCKSSDSIYIHIYN